MNTDTIALSLPYIITIGISSGLFAGLISTLGNILIAYFNKKTERKIEAEKYRNSINEYRYKEMHKYLKNLCDIPSKVYTEEYKKLIEDSNKEYEQVMSIYRKVLPLLDKELKETLIAVLNEVDTISHALTEFLYTNKEVKYDTNDLIGARNSVKNKLTEILQSQLAILLAQGNKRI